LAGNLVLVLVFFFVGPLPFIPVVPTVPLLQAMMGLVGIGFGFVMVSSFARAQNAAMTLGYEKDIETYMMISGELPRAKKLRRYDL
jgi:hypothetical protein